MWLNWKGRGILIVVYFIVTTLVVGIGYRLIYEYFGLSGPHPSVWTILGCILILTGFWTRFTAKDSYIDPSGREKEIDLENEFFFIKMQTWGIYLPALGLLMLIYGLLT